MFTDPFGLCDPKKDPDCEIVSQATVGLTAGSKGGGKLGNLFGLEWRVGATLEGGVRQTINHSDEQTENEGVGVAQIGLRVKATLFGLHVGIRIGYDSEDPDKSFVKVITNPDEQAAFVGHAQWKPVGLGVSGTFKLNPWGAWLRTQPGIEGP
jgi:hypothetical protein